MRLFFVWVMTGGRGVRTAIAVMLCALAWTHAAAQACGADIVLQRPVVLSAAERAEMAAMAPLTMLAGDAPPMSRWDPVAHEYRGIAVDVLCFIAAQTGLRYVIEAGRNETVASKIARVQQGDADGFLSLSAQAERAALGLFTRPISRAITPSLRARARGCRSRVWPTSPRCA